MTECRVQVMDLRTGKVYPSIYKASEELFISIDALFKAYKNGRSEAGGIPLNFKKIGKEWKKRGKGVICVETGEFFPSMYKAGESIGLTGQTISQSIKKGCKAGNYHWREATQEELERERHEGLQGSSS